MGTLTVSNLQIVIISQTMSMKTVKISYFNLHNLIIFAVLGRTRCSLRRSFKFPVASGAIHERIREWPRD